MNERVARRLRHAIYGDGSKRLRSYFRASRNSRTIIADEKRRAYQRMKRAYREGRFVLA